MAFVLAGLTVWLFLATIRVRFERDAARMVFNDNSEAIEQIVLRAGAGVDSLRSALAASKPAAGDSSYVVVSIADRRLWFKHGDSVLFSAPVATGSGRQMVVKGNTRVLRFETPRGRLVVQSRDSMPLWVPPDWHFQEQAAKRHLGLVQLVRGRPIVLKDGSSITVQGNDVVRVQPDGAIRRLAASDGREIVADNRIVIPPFGTNQRRYPDVLGPRRLNLGDGYAIHGTNDPASVGRAVSHGCIRMRNTDIVTLYDMVSVGTLVYIY